MCTIQSGSVRANEVLTMTHHRSCVPNALSKSNGPDLLPPQPPEVGATPPAGFSGVGTALIPLMMRSMRVVGELHSWEHNVKI